MCMCVFELRGLAGQVCQVCVCMSISDVRFGKRRDGDQEKSFCLFLFFFFFSSLSLFFQDCFDFTMINNFVVVFSLHSV